MPRLTEWELWAIASKVLEAEGDDVGDFLLKRVRTLSHSGEKQGVTNWLAIAERVQQLLFGKPTDPRELN